MLWIIEDLVDISYFDDLSCIHYVYIICHLGHNSQVMGDVDDSDISFLLNLFDKLKDLGLDINVQSGCRLVADKKVRVTGKGDGDYHPLPHST